MNLGFGGSGSFAAFTLDTGSTGIVVSADLFTPEPDSVNLGPGRQIYSSSGVIENGTWYTATQDIYDANGRLVATANVPVLRVTSITCEAGARNCVPDDNPTGVSVMGIGFARESSTQTHATPNYNPFLNLTNVVGPSGQLEPVPADWHNGYEVAPGGVYLGLTSTNTANASLVKLLPDAKDSLPGLPEWEPAPMTISVNGSSFSGHVLMDTGLTTSFLSDPGYQGNLATCPGNEGGNKLPAAGDAGGPVAPRPTASGCYAFSVDQANQAMQPPGGLVVDQNSSQLFNTSVAVLNGITFFYDEEDGFIGYITHDPLLARVNPEFALEGPWAVGNGFYTDIRAFSSAPPRYLLRVAASSLGACKATPAAASRSMVRGL